MNVFEDAWFWILFIAAEVVLLIGFFVRLLKKK